MFRLFPNEDSNTDLWRGRPNNNNNCVRNFDSFIVHPAYTFPDAI